MSRNDSFTLTPRDVLQLLKDHPRRWMVPTLVLILLAGVVGFVRPRSWEASQALIIREEAIARQERLGSFGDVNEMKTVQETILELSRSKGVLRTALEEIGPPRNYKKPSEWPTDEDIADLREAMKLMPPGGAEFGKTEVFYLKVKQKDRQRAIRLATVLCDQLQTRFQALRRTKYESVILELSRSEALAETALEQATAQLAELEKQAGVDLAELRILHTSSTSTSDLRQKLVEMENEMRRYEAEAFQHQQLLDLLHAAQENPGRLLATPNSLLDAQPALRRLKEGLIDAQLQTAQLEGVMSAEHPLVIAAKTAQQEIGAQLHNELTTAIVGVEVDLRMNVQRVEALQTRLLADRNRLQRLAAMRADYSNRIAMSQNRTELLERARANLAGARAQQAAAGNVSLINRIDTPDTGTKPVGPGLLVILLGGMFGGLAVGWGIVFLTVDPSEALGMPPAGSRESSARELSLEGDYREPAWN